jgi:hypothetical protein
MSPSKRRRATAVIGAGVVFATLFVKDEKKAHNKELVDSFGAMVSLLVRVSTRQASQIGQVRANCRPNGVPRKRHWTWTGATPGAQTGSLDPMAIGVGCSLEISVRTAGKRQPLEGGSVTA